MIIALHSSILGRARSPVPGRLTAVSRCSALGRRCGTAQLSWPYLQQASRTGRRRLDRRSGGKPQVLRCAPVLVWSRLALHAPSFSPGQLRGQSPQGAHSGSGCRSASCQSSAEHAALSYRATQLLRNRGLLLPSISPDALNLNGGGVLGAQVVIGQLKGGT